MAKVRDLPVVDSRNWLIAAALTAALCLSPASAQSTETVAVTVNVDFVNIQTYVAHDHLVLRIAGPDGYALTLNLPEEITATAVDLLLDAEPRMERRRQEGSEPNPTTWWSLPIGTYHYEVVLYADGDEVGRSDGVFYVEEDGQAFKKALPFGEPRSSATPSSSPLWRVLGAVLEVLVPSAHAQQTFTQDVQIQKTDPALIFNSPVSANWRIRGGDEVLRVEVPGATVPAVTIRTIGSVGIGTAAPQTPLHVDNAGGFQMRLSGSGITTQLDAFQNIFRIGHVEGSLSQFHIHKQAPQNSLAVGSDGAIGIGVSPPGRQLHVSGANAVFRMDRPSDTAAFMLVRTTAGGSPLKTFVVGTDASGANNGQFVINDLGAAVGGPGTRRMTITNAGEVHFTGTTRAPSFVQTSSLRFKDDIETLTDAGQSLERLRGVRFVWKDTGRAAVGLIAEEVAEVYPELVERDAKDGKIAAVNYSAFVGVLVEAVKEQQQQMRTQAAEIASYQSEVAAQQAELAALKARMAEIEAALLGDGMRQVDLTSR